MESKIEKVQKRDGRIVDFDKEKIEEAIFKALTATGKGERKKAKRLSEKVVRILNRRFKKGEIPHVEQIQDIVEEVLILEGLVETAKAYILYREQRRRIREAIKASEEAVERVDQYLEQLDWEVKENANMAFSLQGMNHYVTSHVIRKYWLNKIYPKEIREAHESGDFHLDKLDTLGVYCSGWDLYDLLIKGFGGVPGKLSSKPPKHFQSALGQVVNFIFTIQGECFSQDTQVLTDEGWKYFWEISSEDKIFTLSLKKRKIELQKPIRFYAYDFDGKLYNFKSRKLDLLVTPNHQMLVDQYSPHLKEKYRLKLVKAKDLNPNTHFIPKNSIWEGKEEKYFILPGIQIFQFRNFKNPKNSTSFSLNNPRLAFLQKMDSHPEVFGKVLSLPKNEVFTSQYLWKYEIKEINPKKILMDNWLKFFGFWLAEGCTTLRKRYRKGRENPYYEYQVRLSQNKGEILKKFENLLKKLPFHYRKKFLKNNKKKVEIEITNKQLFLYLRQFGKKETKFIPKEIKNLSKKQLKILFDWMMKGDGYIKGSNIEYSTKSKKLADDFQEIVLKLGWSANISEKCKGKFKWYKVSVSTKRKHFKLKKNNIKRIKYKGKVYCLEVPNHTLYVRRKGKAAWSGNCAGAVAFSNFDTLLAPFIRYDRLTYPEIKQALQEFLFNMATPTRVGFQSPFSNITLDLKPSPVFKNMPVIIGGKPQKETYGEFEEEMKIFNKALYEAWLEGDKTGRTFSFPIPTINITKDFPWDEPAFDGIFEASAKYGVNYFANYIQSDMKPEDVRSMCLDGKEEILIRNSKKIKRIPIKEVAESYKAKDFDKEGWADCKKEGNLEVLSLNPKTLNLEWSPVKRFLKIKDEKAIEIFTEDGKSAIYSLKHPMAIYTQEGIKMKFAKDVKEGERILEINSIDQVQKIGKSKIKLKDEKAFPVSIKKIKIKNYKQLKEFYDIELEKNHLFVHSLGQISFNCCRLRLDLTELYNRGGGGLFGSGANTGSLSVITVNLPRIGYLSKTKKEFFERLAKVMDLAKEVLEIKRKVLENLIEKGLYPYSKVYLAGVKKMRGQYYGNHFSTIGLIGMNEALLNFLGENIASKRGRKFALEVLDFMRERLVKYQKETGNIYNLEATPGESLSYRLALKDKAKYPDIITAGTKKVPYYTNSTSLPVNYTDDLFEALKLQDELLTKYTGGCVHHIFLGERMPSGKMVKKLVKKIFENFKLPYITITPTFSICPSHGYLEGEHFFCPKCTIKQPCEVYSRIVGYYRPVSQYNIGKVREFHDRKTFKIPKL